MEAAYFAGAFVSQFALAALFHLILKKWMDGGVAKLFLVHTAAALAGIWASALGHANGGPLDFWDWPYRAISSSILFVLDIFRVRGKKAKPAE